MIIDVTGIELTPGNFGMDCKGNGISFDENGELIIGKNQYLANIQQDKNYGFKNINKSHWGLVFDKISYGDNAYSTKVQVILKIELGVIVAPEIYYRYMKRNLFNK